MDEHFNMSEHEDRLRAIEVGQAEVLALLRTLTQQFKDRTARSDEWRRKIDRTLYGDGNGHRGANVRLDRLEVAQERSKWFARTVGGAVLVLAVAGIWALLTA